MTKKQKRVAELGRRINLNTEKAVKLFKLNVKYNKELDRLGAKRE